MLVVVLLVLVSLLSCHGFNTKTCYRRVRVTSRGSTTTTNVLNKVYTNITNTVSSNLMILSIGKMF